MQLEKIFDVVGYIEVQNASFAICTLKEEAKHWWRATRETLPLEEGEPLTWGIFL